MGDGFTVSWSLEAVARKMRFRTAKRPFPFHPHCPDHAHFRIRTLYAAK